MTFEYITGDIFTTKMPAIAQGVNLRGVMGGGIAKLIADRFPEILPEYKQACYSRTLTGGGMLPTLTHIPGFYILNLASQDNLGRDARLPWVESSMRLAVEWAAANFLEGFAVPRIGAGIGGLEWDDVRGTIEDIANDANVHVEMWSLPGA